MPNNRRQRRRFVNNNKKTKILIASVIVLAIALLISVVFNFSTLIEKIKSSAKPTEEIAKEETQEQTEQYGPEYQEGYEKEEESNYDFIGPKNGNVTFNITALGDILCHNTQYMDAYNKETDTYDFLYVFEDIKYYTQTGGLTIANLETSFAGKEKGYSNYPKFNTPDELAYCMKDIGVDVITTAGNHCLDMGYEGLERTIDTLDSADISHLGTYKSQEERDKVFIKYIKGVKIAIIDYTYGINGTTSVPTDKQYCVNIINKDQISSDLEKAKETSPDVILACMHWGTEYSTTANDEQKDLTDFLFQNGVDVILGNHPHCLEPMEKRTVTLADGTKKDGFVIYALGNFTADQKEEITKNSIILNLEMTKHTNGKLTIDHAKYVPIHMDKDEKAQSKKFKILDLERTIQPYEATTDLSLGKEKYEYLKKQIENITSIVGPEF